MNLLLWIVIALLWIFIIISHIKLKNQIEKVEGRLQWINNHGEGQLNTLKDRIWGFDFKFKALTKYLKLDVSRPSGEYQVTKIKGKR